MQLLVSDLQRLAESNRPNISGTDGQAPHDPRHRKESANRAVYHHTVSSSESDVHMCGNFDGQNWGIAAHGYGNLTISSDGNSDIGTAAQNHQEVTFLGLNIDSRRDELSLPHQKLSSDMEPGQESFGTDTVFRQKVTCTM